MRALALALIASCAGARVAEPPRSPTPWCFHMAVKNRGAAVGCTERQKLCEDARRDAIQFSGVLKIETIGACHEER